MNKDTLRSIIDSQLETAIADFGLIKDGDKVLVAVSGGKDSLTLLTLLKDIQTKRTHSFELYAAHIKTDFYCASCTHTESLSRIFTALGVQYRLKDIKVLDEFGKTNCFWCSWNKRKALFFIAQELGCNKLALGHHQNDIAETILMNLFFNGEISAMKPNQELFEGEITIIRPLCYVAESLTREFVLQCGFSAKLCKCPFGKDSSRKLTKDIIGEIEERFKGVDIRKNICKSITNKHIDAL